MAAAVATAIPQDVGELWREYGDYVQALVRKLGVPPQDVADVAGTIITRFVEQDVLGMYDPAYISPHTGHPVTFRAFLSAQVAVRVRGLRDKISRQEYRENLICDAPADDTGTRWIDLFGGAAWWDDYSSLDDPGYIGRLRTYLAMQPPRRAGDKLDLVALFDELAAELAAQGQVNRKQVGARFGVSTATVGHWLGHLRGVLSQAPELARPVQPVSWAVGGVTLTAADVQAAVGVLEAAKGIMVRQPLERAGHPLAQAEPRWYHLFAQEEIAAYPEIAVAPQTHKKPAGHVKAAVLHRLWRMLTEAGEPVETEQPVTPPPPDTPQELIEAELWQLGADAATVDRVLGLVESLTVSAA